MSERTTYTVYNNDGSERMYTDSPNVAESHSRIGFTVTAETRKA